MTRYRTFCLVNSSRHLSVKIWADKSWPDDRQSGNSAWKSVVCGFNPSQTYCSLGTIFKDKDGQVMSNIFPIWQVHNRKNDDTTLSLAIYVFGPSETVQQCHLGGVTEIHQVKRQGATWGRKMVDPPCWTPRAERLKKNVWISAGNSRDTTQKIMQIGMHGAQM